MPITSKDVSDAPKAKAEEPKAEEPKSETAKAAAGKAVSVYVANQTGVTNIGGEMFQFRAGVTHISGDDPAYKAHPELFSAVADKARPIVEQTTAAPGEQRGKTA